MTTTFQDIFKSGFLESVNVISLFDMLLTLLLSFALGLFVFYIYKRCCSSIMYSASFGVTLIALCMITSMVILAVTNNVILSLGMVGALSIVRFRTAIKDPSDIAFLFWSIAAGIVLAAGFIELAVTGSLFIGLILLIFSQTKGLAKPYILVLHCSNQKTEQEASDMVSRRVKRLSLKSKSVTPGCIELNYEVCLRDEDTDFINQLAELEGISHTVLVSYNGDYMG